MATTHTYQKTWTRENNGFYAVALAAQRIAAGKTVCFECFTRDNKKDSTEMTICGNEFFGLHRIEHSYALRASKSADLLALNSHSLISSAQPDKVVNDPVFIASALAIYLRLKYMDFFIVEN